MVMIPLLPKRKVRFILGVICVVKNMQPKNDFGPSPLLGADALQQRQCCYLCVQESKNGSRCVQVKCMPFEVHKMPIHTGLGFGHSINIKDRNQLCGIASGSNNKWHIYDVMNLVISVFCQGTVIASNPIYS